LPNHRLFIFWNEIDYQFQFTHYEQIMLTTIGMHNLISKAYDYCTLSIISNILSLFTDDYYSIKVYLIEQNDKLINNINNIYSSKYIYIETFINTIEISQFLFHKKTLNYINSTIINLNLRFQSIKKYIFSTFSPIDIEKIFIKPRSNNTFIIYYSSDIMQTYLPNLFFASFKCSNKYQSILFDDNKYYYCDGLKII
jgi:hypothetical protein